MMSSEEEPDCFALYGDKLSKKAKRSRQRVDAGEPRNSYSSIPNFSSRPSFLSSGLYGALLSQSQHLGLLGQGFPPAKMLNELLGRQVKQGADATTPADNMMTMDPAASEGAVSYDCGPVIRRSLDDGSPPPGDVAHHMLRDILQGRKKEFLALEQEVLRGVGAGAHNDPHSPDNNNSINNNNNNEVKSNTILNGIDVNHMDTNGGELKVNGVREIDSSSAPEDNTPGDDVFSDDGGAGAKSQMIVDDDIHINSGNNSDSEQSVVSPASDSVMKMIKEDPDELSGGKEQPKTEPNDLKRARVENIVSSMRSSPSLPTPTVNGCKKRKWYHPQQHDTTAERYHSAAALGLTMSAGMFIDDDTADNNSLDNTEIRQKKVEKDHLKSQLRTMQEQLAEMQQKYVQLCTRMDQDVECPNEDEGSDIDQDNNSSSLPLTKSPPPPPPPTAKDIASSQQQVLQDQHSLGLHHPHHHHHHPPLPHHALSNAAAMYLGASHKMFMEQEARMSKEAAMAVEQQQQQQQHLSQHVQQQQQQLQHHSAHQQLSCPPAQQQQVTSQGVVLSAPTTPSQHSQANTQTVQTHRMSPSQQAKNAEFTERLNMIRNNSLLPIHGQDLEGLADILKNEISSSLGNLIDTIMSRFVQQKRYSSKQGDGDLLSKELLLQAQLADRKSPRTKVIDRGNNGSERSSVANGPSAPLPPPRLNGTVFPSMTAPHPQHASNKNNIGNNPENNINTMNLPHVRPSPTNSMFQPPKPPTSLGSAAAAAGSLYSSMSGSGPFCLSEPREGAPEQNEALSLVVHPQKKKRHKVTDTRITPRTVSRILAQDGSLSCPPNNNVEQCPKYGVLPLTGSGPSDSPPPPPPPRPYHPPPPPPPMLPVSLPTSVAIPNPSLHESKVFSPYSPFYHHMQSSSPPGMSEIKRESPPISHPPSLLHPALLAAAAQQHGPSPDYNNIRSQHMNASNDNVDRSSDCNSGDGPYDGITPTLRKAKLMFFWVRYPSSAVLKMYFPDIKFNKNNTAQLVKWFSNFREFYYIQMEKYARQAASEGAKASDDLHVSGDCEIYRVLNLHYNRNNHIEVPSNFRYVVEQTLKEFFKAIQGGKDSEQSWKKSIYKIISRLDDPVPEYFKSPNFLEQLE